MTAQPFATKAQAVAVALGPAWTYKPDTWDDGRLSDRAFYLVNSDTGLTLYAWKAWNSKDKFTFQGSYPGHNSLTSDPSAGISLNRTAQAIAADLKRRLIPEAQQLHEQRFAKEAQKDATKAKQYDIAQQIAFALDGTQPDNNPHQRSSSELDTHIGSYPTMTATFAVDYYSLDNQVTINLKADRLPLDAALAIATILRGAMLTAQSANCVG